MPPTEIPYFLYAAGILFREGMEAMLVVVALAAGARDGPRGRRDVYGGALAAILLSIGLAWAVNHVIGDNASDTLEGIFQILAAATLFYVSSWLTAKSQSERWLTFISHHAEDSDKSAVPAMAMGLTAFLAVMREGAETIVFFQALTAGATERVEKHAVAAGIVVAAICLSIAFAILTRAAYRIPLNPFFAVTSVLLYGLAVVFIGQGIGSLQEAGVVGATFVDRVPTIGAIGLYPTMQSIAAQLALLVFAAIALFFPRRTRPTLSVSGSASHAETHPA